MMNLERVTSQALTSAPSGAMRDAYSRSDLLFRIVTTTSDGGPPAYDVRCARTHDVAHPIQQHMQQKSEEVALLVKVVKWQHNLLDYNAHYIAFLLDQTSEEEFEHIAEEFAYEPEALSPATLAPLAGKIYQLTGIPYTPSDLADLFHCDHTVALDAIKRIAVNNPLLNQMLPNVTETTATE